MPLHIREQNKIVVHVRVLLGNKKPAGKITCTVHITYQNQILWRVYDQSYLSASAHVDPIDRGGGGAIASRRCAHARPATRMCQPCSQALPVRAERDYAWATSIFYFCAAAE